MFNVDKRKHVGEKLIAHVVNFSPPLSFRTAILLGTMNSGVKAILFAGGSGSLLYPLVSDDVPKALLRVANRPLMYYPLMSLIQSKILDITVVAAAPWTPYIETYIKKFVQDPQVLAQPGAKRLKISLLNRGDSEGTADVLRNPSIENSSGDYIVLSCDYIGNVDLDKVLEHHRKSKASCTVVLREAKSEEMEAAASTKNKEKGKGSKYD